MKAAREAFLLICLLCLLIWPLTPGGCYAIYSAKDGYGDRAVVEQYLKDRTIPFKERELSRRNLGITRNCEASFLTDVAALKKLAEVKDSKVVAVTLTAPEKKALARSANRQSSLINILALPPTLSDAEKADYARAFELDNLLIFSEAPQTLPKGWTDARLFVTKIDGKARLYYAR